MSEEQVKKAIRKMKKYDINKLAELSNKSGRGIMRLQIWFNAIHN